jgi:hypothetical protein
VSLLWQISKRLFVGGQVAIFCGFLGRPTSIIYQFPILSLYSQTCVKRRIELRGFIAFSDRTIFCINIYVLGPYHLDLVAAIAKALFK